jgi:hypothetical protein
VVTLKTSHSGFGARVEAASRGDANLGLHLLDLVTPRASSQCNPTRGIYRGNYEWEWCNAAHYRGHL